MFHTIPPQVQARMRYLERLDAADRKDGTPRLQRLRQIPPETGQFLAIMAAAAPQGKLIEIGTSAGYSTMWLALACRASGRRVTTFEILPEKAALARETFQLANLEEVVELVEGDARKQLPEIGGIAFCFLDAEKEVYEECYRLIVPRLVRGGLLVADNVISHADTLRPMVETAVHDERLDALVVPLGNGLLVGRRG
ncbi:MAG: O-methyltransferase [Anaerolineae bacterium]